MPTVADVARAIEDIYNQPVPHKYVREVVHGYRRPAPNKAWKIGQALQYLSVGSWSGPTMLYVAGWYQDYIGACVLYVYKCVREDYSSLFDGVKCIRNIPRILTAPTSMESSSTNFSAIDEKNLDSRRLQSAWLDWQQVQFSESLLATRARSIALMKDIKVEIREREAVEYLRTVFSDPDSLDEQLSQCLENK